MSFPDFTLDYRLRGSADATVGIKLVSDPDVVLVANVWSALQTIVMSRTDPATEDLFTSNYNQPLSGDPLLDHLLVLDLLVSGVVISGAALYTLEIEATIDGGTMQASLATLYGNTWRLVARQELDLTINLRGMGEDVTYAYLDALPAFPGTRPTRIVVGDNVHLGGDLSQEGLTAVTTLARRLGGNQLGIGGGAWGSASGAQARITFQAAGYAWTQDAISQLDSPLGGYCGQSYHSGGTTWPDVNPYLVAEADDQLADFLSAGWTADALRHFHHSDEAGWNLPTYFNLFAQNAIDSDKARFTDYLQTEYGFTPADVGHSTWDTVLPSQRSTVVGAHGTTPLTARKLFYASARWPSYAAAEYMLRVTNEFQRVFPQAQVSTNWNNEGGYRYKPGVNAGESPPKTSANARVKIDWFQFGAMGGGSALWTEDWFGDPNSWKWSFYGALMRGAGKTRTLPISGYVVGRGSGQIAFGLADKVLTLLFQGAKKFQWWTLGPVYNQVANGYSDVGGMALGGIALLEEIQAANALVGAVEDALYPGVVEPAAVAILYPTSSDYWTEIELDVPTAAQGKNWWDLEVMQLYRALVGDQIAVDMIDGTMILAGVLAHYAVLLVTEPNISLTVQAAIAAWVDDGGVLLTTPCAGSRDEFDTAVPDATPDTIDAVCGIVARPAGTPDQEIEVESFPSETITQVGGNPPLLGSPLPNFRWANVAERVTLGGDVTVRGQFPDASPAVWERAIGNGWSLHFNTYPGHAATGAGTLAVPAISWLRYGILTLGEIARQVTSNRVRVETLVLRSVSGGVTTYAVGVFWRDVLGSTTLALQVAHGGRAVVVTSVVEGVLTPTITTDAVEWDLGSSPMQVVDVVTVEFTEPTPSPLDVPRGRALLLGVG